MKVFNLIGLISAISLIIYFILYFIKANYQQKYISSTYIWKLSLKYKKRKLNINKFRNILLVITQVLLLITLTIVTIKPVKITKEVVENEEVVIIDASASMRTVHDDKTRFERAVELATKKVNQVLSSNGTISIVVGTDNPYFIAEKQTIDSYNEINNSLTQLLENDRCSYSSVDLNESIKLCDDILEENSNVKISIYTDISADYVENGITVVNVNNTEEYNVAILDAKSYFVDNYYTFEVELASYGKDSEVELVLDLNKANASDIAVDGSNLDFSTSVQLVNDEVKKVIFTNSNNDNVEHGADYFYFDDASKIFSFESAHLSINVNDSYYYDNSFDIYGGTKETIKVLYASSLPNSFFNGMLFVLRSALADSYNIELTEFKNTKLAVPNSGYDLYIYEHNMMPDSAPKDGVVIYSDPNKNVGDSGFVVSSIMDFNGISSPLTEVNSHKIVENVNADDITISSIDILSSSKDYETIFECNKLPAIMVKDNEYGKSILMLFSLHYSNLALLKDFPVFLSNIFTCYFPRTTNGNSFNVNDAIEINSRGNQVYVMKDGETKDTLISFPSSVSYDLPGTYIVNQTTFFGKEIEDKILVRIPKEECDINTHVESIVFPFSSNGNADYYDDLLLWLSIALVSLLFIEWLLKGNDTL